MPSQIIIADDDADMRHMLEVVFGHAGLSVACAASGTELMKQVEALARSHRRPVAIVSDVHMPGLTGLEALPQIRAAFPDVPIVLITAFGDSMTHSRARELGAAAVFDKPFSLIQLRDEVLSQLGQGGASP